MTSAVDNNEKAKSVAGKKEETKLKMVLLLKESRFVVKMKFLVSQKVNVQYDSISSGISLF